MIKRIKIAICTVVIMMVSSFNTSSKVTKVAPIHETVDHEIQIEFDNLLHELKKIR